MYLEQDSVGNAYLSRGRQQQTFSTHRQSQGGRKKHRTRSELARRNGNTPAEDCVDLALAM